MSEPRPIVCLWDGESFAPASQRWARVADKDFVVGEQYALVRHEDRSPATHRHFFACVNEAWKNLPEGMEDRFPNAESLRKYALIKAGYRDERSIVCASKAEALRVKAFVEPIDDFAIVLADGATVTVFTAKSQSQKAMGKKTFQESKDAVLRIIAELIGTDPTTLKQSRAA